jgi:hypothetical protein
MGRTPLVSRPHAPPLRLARILPSGRPRARGLAALRDAHDDVVGGGDEDIVVLAVGGGLV